MEEKCSAFLFLRQVAVILHIIKGRGSLDHELVNLLAEAVHPFAKGKIHIRVKWLGDMDDASRREETEELPFLEGRANADDWRAEFGWIAEGSFRERADAGAIGPDVRLGEDEHAGTVVDVFFNGLAKGLGLLRVVGKRQGGEHHLQPADGWMRDGFMRTNGVSASRESNGKRRVKSVAGRGMIAVNEVAFAAQMRFFEFLFADDFVVRLQFGEKPKHRHGEHEVDEHPEETPNQIAMVELEVLGKRALLLETVMRKVVLKRILIIKSLLRFHA